MAIVIDILAVLILLLGIFVGIKRGFVRSAVKLCGCIAAILLAAWLSSFAANWAYDTFLKVPIENNVAQSVTSIMTSSQEATAETLDQIINGLPDFLKQALSAFDLGSSADLFAQIEQGGMSDGTVPSMAAGLVDFAVKPVCVLLLQFLSFVIIFILLMIVVSLLAKLLDRIFRLPVLKQLNGLLGGVLGLIEFALILLVLVTFLQLYAVSAREGDLITQRVIDQSFVVKWIAEHNPLLRFGFLNGLL